MSRPAASPATQLVPIAAALLVTLASLGGVAPSQSASPGAGATPPSNSAAKLTPGRPAPAAVPKDQIAIVDGIPLVQSEWDRLAKPYFEEVAARAGRPLTDDERKLLQRNIMDELIRERLWIADAKRRGITVTEPSADSRMKQSAFFKTNGQTDDAKFQAFKRSPSSNYPELREQTSRTLLLEDYTRWMERRFGPREADLKRTFEERTSQASIRYFLLSPDAISLEPEATATQIRAYYDTHQDEFESPEEVHIQYIRMTAPQSGDAAGDTAPEAASRAMLKSAVELIDAVRAGTPVETAAKPHGGLNDSGWFRLGEPVRGLGRSDALVAAIRATNPGEWIQEPIRIGPLAIVARLVDRHQARRLPFHEVVAQAKRKADAVFRDDVLDSLARAEMHAHPEKYHAPRVTATIVARDLASFDAGRPPRGKETEKRLNRLRKELNIPETAKSWIDSTRAGIPDLILRERRVEAGVRAMREAASKLKKKEDASRVASGIMAKMIEFRRYRGEPPSAPLLVEGGLLDSLYTLRAGDVIGPRIGSDSVFVVRVERVDSNFLPPYEAVRPAARASVTERRWDEQAREAEGYFQKHRGEYRTATRWVVDYVYFRKAKPSEIQVFGDSIAAYWKANPLEFTEPGKAKIRHILVSYHASEGSAAREAARTKAIAARKRIVAGEAFAAVAREMSDDPGSSAKGGELGELTRGTVVKEFGDEAFTIAAGEVSNPVETRFGFHILQVEERKLDRLRPLEECREEIQGVIRAALADSLARKAATAFAAAAGERGASFDSLAAMSGGATRSKPVGANEPIGNLGPVPWLEKAVGSLPDGGVTAEPITLPGGYVVLRRVREVAPQPASFEQVRDRAFADHQSGRRRDLADSLDAEFRSAIQAGADPETLFIALGGLRVSRQFGRQGPIPDFSRDPGMSRDSTYIDRIFSAKAGTVLQPLKGNLGTLYGVVDSVSILPPADFAKHRDELLRELVDQRIEAWTARLRAKAPIRIYRKDLQAHAD